MKFKKLINICLIISILFASISPISFAAYVYGPGSSSYTLNWKNLHNSYGSNDYYPSGYATIEAIEVKVTESGLYNISNVMGGNVSTKFIICGDTSANGINSISPLPVATYGTDNRSEMNLERYNSSANKTASVYLEAGQTYYVLMTGEKGSGLKDNFLDGNNSASESSTLTINVEKINVPSGMTIYETEFSSTRYTASNLNARRQIFKSDSSGGSNVSVKLNNLATNSNLTSISGDALNEALQNATTVTGESQNAAWYEKIITWLMLLIGDGVRAAISWAMGDDISIDNILFNEYDNIRLAIFDSSRVEGKSNGYLETSGLLDSPSGDGVITKYFMLFRNIAIAVYIIMLLYMGIRILLASTGSKKEKYKSKLSDWVKGIVILTFFPYIMKYTIVLNDVIVEYIAELKEELPSQINLPSMTGVSSEQGSAMNLVNSGVATNGDIMETMRVTASKTGRMAYAVLYLLLLKELVTFIYIYFKRLIAVIFLVVIFPLVTISYAVDKIADGKSQAFDNWYNEFFLNVFMQAFQAVNYVIIMSIIFALTTSGGAVNIILVLVGFEYLSKGDELLRSMFTKMTKGSAGSVPRTLSEAAKTIATVQVVKKVSEGVSGVGNRVRNLNNRVKEVRKSYDNYREAKHDERVRNRQAADAAWENSIMNPEKHALDNVHGNIEKAFNLSGTVSSREQKEALDRLMVARNDPNRRAIFDAEYSALSAADKDKLDKLLEANAAVNDTINGNRGIKGALTQREININANIIMDIVSGGSTGQYGGLYDYLSAREMRNPDGTPMLDSSGAHISVIDYLTKEAGKRTLNADQQVQFNKAQAFLANVPGLDGSSNGTSRVSTSRHAPIPERPVSATERARARAIQTRYGTTGVSAEIEEKQKRAAALVARMKGYKFDIDSGASPGMSATEGMRLAMEWEALAKETDTGVQAILDQVGDAASSGHAMEANVGFTLEQFKTMASIAVMSDKANLIGTDEEKEKMIAEAGKTIVEVATSSKLDDDASGRITITRHTADKVARNMVQRAEMDDFVREYSARYATAASNGDSISSVRPSDYIRTVETQEQIRDREEIKNRRRQLEGHYRDANKPTVSQTRAQLVRSAVNVTGAATSVVLTPVNLATGVAMGALVTGADGDTKPISMLGATAAGMALENTVESTLPGTAAASRKNSRGIGARIDRSAGEAIGGMGLTEEQRSDELLAWDRTSNSVNAKNNLYRNRINH